MFEQLSDWLTYIEGLHPKDMVLGLDRVRQVYQKMQLDMSGQAVVTIGGTNGKGSTLACLEAMAIKAGVNVGSYTSPHILHFNERIRVNCVNASDQMLCAAFKQVEDARQSVALTYFEFTTLASLVCFQQASLDLILLEVGLGGRLDAVNILDADIAVITSIGLDHQHYLGETLEQIAAEKAGILRENKPCVVGPWVLPSTLAASIEALKCPLFGGNQLKIQSHANQDASRCTTWDFGGRTVAGEPWVINGLPVPNVLLENAAIAIQTLGLLAPRLGLSLRPVTIKAALQDLQVPGRWQKLAAPFPVYLDIAHNEPAAKALAMKVASLGCNAGNPAKVIALFGAMADKDISAMIAALKMQIHHWYLLQLPGSRAVSVGALRKMLNVQGVEARGEFTSMSQAWDVLKKRLDPASDVLLIWGSFSMAEAALQLPAWRD